MKFIAKITINHNVQGVYEYKSLREASITTRMIAREASPAGAHIYITIYKDNGAENRKVLSLTRPAGAKNFKRAEFDFVL